MSKLFHLTFNEADMKMLEDGLTALAFMGESHDLQKLQAKYRSFSHAGSDDCGKAKLTVGPPLDLTSDATLRAEIDEDGMKNKPNGFTFETLKSMLSLIKKTTGREASCRIVVDTIVLYVVSNLDTEPGQAVTIVPEEQVPSTAFDLTRMAFGGYLDYLILRGPRTLIHEHPKYKLKDSENKLHHAPGFTASIIETKRSLALQKRAMSQTVAELATYCLAKRNTKICTRIPNIKGFLTDGRRWKFLAFRQNEKTLEDDGSGQVSSTEDFFDIGDRLENLAFVVGLIRRWIEDPCRNCVGALLVMYLKGREGDCVMRLSETKKVAHFGRQNKTEDANRKSQNSSEADSYLITSRTRKIGLYYLLEVSCLTGSMFLFFVICFADNYSGYLGPGHVLCVFASDENRGGGYHQRQSLGFATDIELDVGGYDTDLELFQPGASHHVNFGFSLPQGLRTHPASRMMVSYLPEFPCPPTSTSHHSLVRVVSSTLKKTADNILDGRLSHSFIFPTVLGFTSLPKSHENLSFVCVSTSFLNGPLIITQWIVMKLSRFSNISQTKSIFPMGPWKK
ncbi:uncharacterized protein LACBIDRAFT_320951 [Laccaria bicolor S238N-H82]|uniref:Predicted protein n=1 Tax=Laccaria bicolor (strain S238N-H82 / ATCC MYA-4686) TaxID=486041 RepID=B0CNA1_LACBS|nr:uncharacterized protein LACBIDRAFT_320951 [Laccaria bicolor S238N-H82]EDR15894.1 predicted protein [Laccaria bicolor S238N-H82]|eukprot:XP_001874102.1 predicted protein [Laccaria bicolor S238N-H82]